MPNPAIVVNEEPDRNSELESLGLEVDRLVNAIRFAEADVRACSPNDPILFRGLMRWARVTSYLRDQLEDQGWTAIEINNSPATVSPSGKVHIVVATGDINTGSENDVLRPTTQYKKGTVLKQAVEQNIQLDLFGPQVVTDLVAGSQDNSSAVTWLLLVRSTPDAIYAELSCPSSFDASGWVTSWSKRISLPTIVFDSVQVDLDEAAKLIDVPITRRKSND